jgi:hypothetical protein
LSVSNDDSILYLKRNRPSVRRRHHHRINLQQKAQPLTDSPPRAGLSLVNFEEDNMKKQVEHYKGYVIETLPDGKSSALRDDKTIGIIRVTGWLDDLKEVKTLIDYITQQ